MVCVVHREIVDQSAAVRVDSIQLFGGVWIDGIVQIVAVPALPRVSGWEVADIGPNSRIPPFIAIGIKVSDERGVTVRGLASIDGVERRRTGPVAHGRSARQATEGSE